MSVYKIVMNTFIFVGKTGKSTGLTQGRELFVSSGKKLMSITLMAYIPDYCILRTVEGPVKCYCKLNYSKITGKMAAVFSYNIDYSSTDFGSELLEFLLRKLFYILR